MAGDPFTWPPRTPPPDAPPHTPPPAPTPRRVTSRAAALAHELAELWLAPTAPPFRQRAARAGWSPDAPGRWCDRCGLSVGPYEENEFGCAECRGSRPPWDRAVRLGEHRGELRRWIHEIKFTQFRRLGVSLGRELGAQLRAAGCPGRHAVVCPMPMAYRHRVARGIDHAGAIASGVARELGLPLMRPLRRAHRPSQTDLPASQRQKNVAGAYTRRRAHQRPRFAGKTVILVDDVLTTGASARAAARALTRGLPEPGRPAAVWLAVLAAAPRPGSEDPENVQALPAEGVSDHFEKKE